MILRLHCVLNGLREHDSGVNDLVIAKKSFFDIHKHKSYRTEKGTVYVRHRLLALGKSNKLSSVFSVL